MPFLTGIPQFVLFIVVKCTARPSEPLRFSGSCVLFLIFLFSYLSKKVFLRPIFFPRLSEKVRCI